MNDWSTISEWLFKGTVSIILFLGWWAWTELVKSVKELSGKQSMHERHVAEYYVTKNDLNTVRIETLDGLKRVHDRIDEGNKQREANFQQTAESISAIKTILIDVARKQ